MDNIERAILERVCLGELPLKMNEAKAIAPLARFIELGDAGLIENRIIKGGVQYAIHDFQVLKVNRQARVILAAEIESEAGSGVIAMLKRNAGKLAWVVIAAVIGWLLA